MASLKWTRVNCCSTNRRKLCISADLCLASLPNIGCFLFIDFNMFNHICSFFHMGIHKYMLLSRWPLRVSNSLKHEDMLQSLCSLNACPPDGTINQFLLGTLALFLGGFSWSVSMCYDFEWWDRSNYTREKKTFHLVIFSARFLKHTLTSWFTRQHSCGNMNQKGCTDNLSDLIEFIGKAPSN